MRVLTRSLVVAAAVVGVTGCVMTLGEPEDIPVSAIGLQVDEGADTEAVASALRGASADIALLAGPVDSAWLASLAAATELTPSGPAVVDGTAMGFLAGEPLGDTTVALQYDGGELVVHDALYDLAERRFLDLLIFRLEDEATARPAIRALVEYMATDVDNSAAVVIAAVVPTAALGDTIGRMLSPAYFDALRCEPGLSAPSERAGIRVFYGPEARVYCTSAAAEPQPFGDLVRAALVLGRR